jgi:hypothetical protein
MIKQAEWQVHWHTWEMTEAEEKLLASHQE